MDIADFRHIRVRIRVVADGVAFLCYAFYKLRLRLKIIADEEECCLYAVFLERVQNSLRVAVFKAGIERDVDLFLVRRNFLNTPARHLQRAVRPRFESSNPNR